MKIRPVVVTVFLDPSPIPFLPSLFYRLSVLLMYPVWQVDVLCSIIRIYTRWSVTLVLLIRLFVTYYIFTYPPRL